MKKTLLILMTLFTTVVSYSQTTFTDTNFITYEVLNASPPYTVRAISYDFANGGSAVNIPNSVSFNSINYSVIAIGDNAFTGNASTGAQLTSVTIPNTVIGIGYNAFANNLLTNLIMPDSVTQIGAICFINNQLTSVTISNNLMNIATGAFQDNDLTNVVIPNSVTSIEGNAFFNNQLTSLTIPSNVALIGQRAFANNPLTTVTCLGTTTVPAVSTNTNPPTSLIDSISYDRGTINLIIPIGTTSAYLANGWTGFASTTENVLSTSSFELEKEVKVITTADEIRIVTSNSLQLKSYVICNMSGAKVASGNKSEISTTFLAGGIYILQLDFNKGSVIKKVVIK